MEVRQASSVDAPAGALMYSHRFLKVSGIIAPNWSLKEGCFEQRNFFLGRLEGS